ncbi:MAG: hypothetical protein JHC28_04010 [Thermoprotei archaeon]|nr:hypothetical protein [Thermoprotei archaeon]
MSLIRFVYNIEEPKEYFVSALRVEPPSNIRDPFKVRLFLSDGSSSEIEAVVIRMKKAMVEGEITKNCLSVKIGGEGCLSKLELSFPRGAHVTLDNGILTIE